MAWFKRDKKRIENSTPVDERRVRTEGLWIKCDACRAIIWKKDLQANWQVCPKCDHHFRLSSKRRLDLLLDDGLWTEHDAELISSDPLVFSDTKPYAKRLKDARDKLGMNDAIVTAEGTLSGRPVICCSMEFGFIGGSMGAVVGEKVARAIERSIESKVPLIIVSCSGGARMMEGTVSLMQLAKVSAALAHLDDARIPFISILTDPTTGGVTASYAMLGDLEYRRARRPNWLCWPARNRADHPPKATRRFPTRRIPPRARLPRRRSPAQRNEAVHRPRPRLLPELFCSSTPFQSPATQFILSPFGP